MLVGLATGNAVGLAAAAAVFIVFALAASFLLPRRNPDFPGRRLPAFLVATTVLFVAMMAAVLVLAREAEEGHAEPAAEQAEPAGETGDAEAGAEVFASAGCGSCHAFEAAGSTATAAPDLDGSSVGFEAAVEQIRNGGGGMPPFAGQLSDEQIRDVATFVVERRS